MIRRLRTSTPVTNPASRSRPPPVPLPVSMRAMVSGVRSVTSRVRPSTSGIIAECRCDQRQAHVACVAEHCRRALERRLARVDLEQELAEERRDREDGEPRAEVGCDEGSVQDVGQRRGRHQGEQERRQGEVEDEGVDARDARLAQKLPAPYPQKIRAKNGSAVSNMGCKGPLMIQARREISEEIPTV